MAVSGLRLGLRLTVAAKAEIADQLFGFRLVAADGGELPAFTPGAHLSIETPAGIVNKYSIASSPSDRGGYDVVIQREPEGEGGSTSMADEVQPGRVLAVSMPDNAFEFLPGAAQYLFVAGGIGITPIHSMVRHMVESGMDNFKLYYLTRDEACTAYRDEFQAEPFRQHVVIHHSRPRTGRFDLWPVFEKPRKAMIYCCGPRGLMESVRDMTGHWSRSAVKFERFGVDRATRREDRAFDVTLARSGWEIHVPANSTLLEALRNNGVAVRSSCESGTCGTCMTPLVSGDVDHRDMCLEDDEREHQIMVCVSRARSGRLVLDL